MPKKVKPIPKGYHSVSPALNQANAADTIAFCKKVFGAKEKMRMAGPGGKIMHAEILIGDSVVMLNDAMQEPRSPPGSSSTSPTSTRCSRRPSPRAPRC